MEDDAAAAKLLLDSGNFDVKDPTLDKGTALRWAAEHSHIGAVKLLIGVGADVTSKDPEDGSTALYMASHFGDLRLVKYLVEHVGGIDIEERDTLGRTVLASAAEYGCPDIVRYYLDECAADVDTRDNYGSTPVHYASLFGHGSTIELLLSKGIEVEAKDDQGRPALYIAAGTAMPEVIDLLVEKGGDLHTTDERGWTALHHATRKNVRVMVMLLLDKGVNVDIMNDEGRTPLGIAAEWGLKDMVVLLLDRDADVMAVDYNLWTPLHYAACYDHLAIVEYLLKRGAEDGKDCEEDVDTEQVCTALDLAEMEENWAVVELLKGVAPEKEDRQKKKVELYLSAAEAGRVSEVKRLLEKRVDKDAADPNGRSALSLAAEKGHLTIVDVLLERECKVGLRDDSEQSPLWWAARFGHVEIVRRLLKGGASVNGADHTGQTPLSAAAQKGHEAVVGLLLEESADMDKKTAYGKTALIFAAGNGYLPIVELLLRNGADMEHSAKNGETAMALAMKNGHKAVEELLGRRGATTTPKPVTDSSRADDGSGDEDEEDDLDITGADDNDDGRPDLKKLAKGLLNAAKLGRIATTKRLLRIGTKTDCRDDDGHTPFMLAAEHGHLIVAKLLFEAGANIEARNKSKETVLWRTVFQGQLKSTKFLLDNGAKTEARNNKGRVPLLCAAEFGRHEALELLIEREADTEAKGKQGRTALWVAVFNENEECVRILLRHHANLECMDQTGQTPLSVAVTKGSATMVRLLLEAGAKMEVEAHGKSPLCIAAESGYEVMLQPLINNGAVLDHRSDGGRTPLMLAAEAGRGMVVKLLIEMGAQADARNDEGRTAQSLAKESGHEEVAKLLLRAAVIREKWEQAQKITFPGGKPGDFYQYDSLSGKNWIRLLELHPGTNDDIISFELHEVNLPDISLGGGPVYEALSYEWGDKFGSIPVQCGDQLLLVTPNLKAALKRLRLEEGIKTLWIDALCINQDDPEERSSQVTLMARLYREARTVSMWLGNGTDKTAAAAVHLPALVKAHDIIRRAEPQRAAFAPVTFDEKNGFKDTLLPLLKPITDDKDAIDGFKDLFHRPYFTRAWILQEIILTKRGNILCGPHRWDWHDFKKAITVVQECGAHIDHKLRVSVAVGELFSLIALYSDYGFLLLQHACMAMREYKASDPRDKIYAPLGLSRVEKSAKGTIVVPDYGSSVRDVFVSAARHFVEQHQLLSFWGDSNQHAKKKIGGLPTWVPDWTMGTYENILTTPRLCSKGHLVKGALRVKGVGEKGGTQKGEAATLSLNAYVMDRVAFAVSLPSEADVYDTVLSAAKALARMGRTIFGGRPGTTPAGAEGKAQSNLEAMLHAVSWARAQLIANAGFKLKTTVEDVLPYLAWRISTDASLDEEQRKVPLELEGRVHEWAAKAADPLTPGFDLDVCRTIEGFVQYKVDLVYTEKGYFGVTNLGEAVRDAGEGGSGVVLVTAILSTVEEVALLRIREDQECVKYYEYVDGYYAYDLQRAFKTLEEVEVRASNQVEQIEIR